MSDLAALTKRNAERWAAAKMNRAAELVGVARRLVASKARYKAVEAKTGVPWFVIAVTHYRESSQNWNRSLAQGDPWDRVSVHVPAGRGPFKSWEEAAIDALVNCAPHAARWKDWSPGGTLTLLEQYNGLIYANAGVPSPYIWSGTDQYKSGKVLVDHGPIEPVVDKQLGCAGLLLAMQQQDDTIRFGAVPAPLPKGSGTAGGIVVAGTAAATVAHNSGLQPSAIIAIIVAAVALAVIGFFIVRKQ